MDRADDSKLNGIASEKNVLLVECTIINFGHHTKEGLAPLALIMIAIIHAHS